MLITVAPGRRRLVRTETAVNRNHITQRQARQLKQRVAELECILEKQRDAWNLGWPDGVHIGNVSWDGPVPIAARIFMARQLSHAVVVSATNQYRLDFYALPLGSTT